MKSIKKITKKKIVSFRIRVGDSELYASIPDALKGRAAAFRLLPAVLKYGGHAAGFVALVLTAAGVWGAHGAHCERIGVPIKQSTKLGGTRVWGRTRLSHSTGRITGPNS